VTLALHDLRFTFPGWPPTLRGIDLQVGPGELGFLLGPSGGGKTTLLRCIAGLEQGYTGSVAWQGAPLDPLPPHARGVGMLFQEPALFPHLNVWRNVAFGMRYHGISRAQERTRAFEWLALVGLGERADAAVDELSGGQRQRIALVRTLAARPRIVLLDEPLSALDGPMREDLGPRVRELLRREKVAALWVTHDEDESGRLADKTWRLVDGRVEPVHRR
jgi:thiamine transport system ATP-binding protein